MPEVSNPSAQGQAPTSGQPQAGIDPTPQAGAGTPQQTQPSQPNGGQQGSLSASDYERMLADVRKEAAGHRTKAGQLEQELNKFREAQLSDVEKAQKRLADLERANSDYQRELQEVRLTRAIERKAQALGIIDPEAATKLLDWSELDYDESGNPKNLDKLLASLVSAKPYLVATQAAQPQRPPASSGGATNPGAGARTGVITKSSYAAMSQQERSSRNKEVLEIMRQNGGRLPD